MIDAILLVFDIAAMLFLLRWSMREDDKDRAARAEQTDKTDSNAQFNVIRHR